MIFSTLEQQIQKLIHLHQQSVASNKKLSEKISTLEQKIEDQNKLISDLEVKNKAIKLANALNENGGNNEELKNEIGQYIKEIDKCIELLNKDRI